MSMPIAKIEYDKIGKCEGNFNNFALKRKNYVNSVNDQNFWSDAGTSIGTDTVISYKQNTPGKYIVKLKLVSEYGCPDSTTQELEIQSRPDIRIARDDDKDSCLNQLVTLRSWENNGLYLKTRLWSFAVGGNKTDSLVTNRYFIAGNNTVQIIGSGGRFNCKDTTTFDVVMYNLANVKFQRSNNTLCFRGNEFTLTDTFPFTFSDWVKTNFSDGVNTGGPKNSNATNNVIKFNTQRNVISNFEVTDTNKTKRPITHFNYIGNTQPTFQTSVNTSSLKSFYDLTNHVQLNYV
jgi:hypothetical protein